MAPKIKENNTNLNQKLRTHDVVIKHCTSITWFNISTRHDDHTNLNIFFMSFLDT
jgi:hypothetical protein